MFVNILKANNDPSHLVFPVYSYGNDSGNDSGNDNDNNIVYYCGNDNDNNIVYYCGIDSGNDSGNDIVYYCGIDSGNDILYSYCNGNYNAYSYSNRNNDNECSYINNDETGNDKIYIHIYSNDYNNL